MLTDERAIEDWIVYQLQLMILLLYEALRDLLSEWTSLNAWFI